MQRSIGFGGVSAQDYGISSAYVYGPQTYGANYADIYKKIDNTNEYQVITSLVYHLQVYDVFVLSRTTKPRKSPPTTL